LRWTVRRAGNNYIARLLDDSGASGSVEIERMMFEAPDSIEPLESSTVIQPFVVPSSGGMFVARRGDFTARVIIPPVVKGLEDFRCNPRISDRARSPDRLPRFLTAIRDWSGARLTGNLLAETRQREVLLALTRHLFFIIAGERWERAELSVYASKKELLELKRAISTKPVEAGLGAALAIDCAHLAKSSESQRIERLAALARRFLELREPYSICEFALRLASNPENALAWAARHNSDGLNELCEKATLARAARFLVLAIDREIAGSNLGARQLYAGWEWD